MNEYLLNRPSCGAAMTAEEYAASVGSAPGGETVTAENMVRLEDLDTPIPPEQLQNFLQREGSSILLVRRWQ